MLGEPIVPKEYKKMVIKNNQVTEEIFTIYGRKIPLTKIRKKLLQNKVKYLRDPPDFDNLESTELMKYFKTLLENQLNQFLKQKKSSSYCHTLVTFKFGMTILPLQIMVTLWSQSIPVTTKTSTILERNIKKRQE